jgi:SAM-dependent methyltransferase
MDDVSPTDPAASSRPAFWNARYQGPEYLFGHEPSQFVRRQSAHLAPRSRVLCIADGEGRNSVFLAALGHDVHANDVSPRALDKARALARTSQVDVRFAQVDLADFNWPVERYDAVFAVFVQFAPPKLRDRIFAGLKGCVVPGGLVFLHGYTPQQLEYRTGGPPDVELLYTPELLAEAFSDCEIVDLHAYEAVLDEGEGHSGRSALIDLVARPSASLGRHSA